MSAGLSNQVSLAIPSQGCVHFLPFMTTEVLGLDNWRSSRKPTSHARLALCLLLISEQCFVNLRSLCLHTSENLGDLGSVSWVLVCHWCLPCSLPPGAECPRSSRCWK